MLRMQAVFPGQQGPLRETIYNSCVGPEALMKTETPDRRLIYSLWGLLCIRCDLVLDLVPT